MLGKAGQSMARRVISELNVFACRSRGIDCPRRIWDSARALDSRTVRRKQLLEQVNSRRNAIVHQDFGPDKVGRPARLRLQDVNAWRKACGELARVFDKVMGAHLEKLLGSPPWLIDFGYGVRAHGRC